MIIDCHVHLNNYEEQLSVAPSESMDRLQAAMEASGTVYSLILTSYVVTPHRPSTAEVVRMAEQFTNVGVVAGFSYLHAGERDLAELREFLQDGRVKGIKLYPGYEPFYPHDRKLEPVYDLAAEFNVPVMIHCGDTYSATGKLKFAHPLEVDEVAVDHRDVKFVICHLGNPWLVDCMEVVYKNRNVFADFSGLVLGSFTEAFEDYMEEQLGDLIRYAGEPRYLLYGSDWPICDMKSYVAFVRQLTFPESQIHSILYENTRRLFNLPLPPRAPVHAAS